MTRSPSRQRLAANAEQAEWVITPDVRAIGLLDFRRLDEAVAAARHALDASAAGDGGTVARRR